jgi:hypothetical protein
MRRGCAVLGVGGVAAGCALFAAPAAFAAAEPPALPAAVVSQIAQERLYVEVSHGWEAVVGSPHQVDRVGSLAKSLGVGSVVLYTQRRYEPGHWRGEALLVFTGNHNDPIRFGISGGTIRSVANDTNQTWYLFADNGERDASLAPGTVRNVKPVDAVLTNKDHKGHYGSFDVPDMIDEN